MSIWDVPARLWTIARKVEDLLELQSKTRAALEAIETRLYALEDRMTHLEAGQAQIIIEEGCGRRCGDRSGRLGDR